MALRVDSPTFTSQVNPILDTSPVADMTSAFLIKRNIVKKAIARRAELKRSKGHIHPKNAEAMIPHLPTQEGDLVHAVIRGDFVLGDLIPPIIDSRGKITHLVITTLGLSEANSRMLARLLDTGAIAKLEMLVGNFFANVEKVGIWQLAKGMLLPRGVRIGIDRNHAKLIMMRFETGPCLVIEGSANLRSSGNTEQLSIFADSELFDFHAEWVLPIIAGTLVTE